MCTNPTSLWQYNCTFKKVLIREKQAIKLKIPYTKSHGLAQGFRPSTFTLINYINNYDFYYIYMYIFFQLQQCSLNKAVLKRNSQALQILQQGKFYNNNFTIYC